MDLGHWQYPGEFNPEDWFGFIYRVIDNTNDMEYIGKKQFWSITRKVVKLRKNRKIVKKESDWKSYTSSSDYVNDAILKKGKEHFTFLIESLYKKKGSLHYAEIESQVNEDVLRAKLPNGERKYYNRSIGNVKFVVGVTTEEEINCKISELRSERTLNTDNHYFKQMTPEEKEEWRLKYRIYHPVKNGLSDDEYKEWCQKTYGGENNPMYGRRGDNSPRFGKKPFDNLSTEQLQLVKEKCSHPGDKNGMYGRHPFSNLSEEELIKVKEKMAHYGEENGMYGRPWYLDATEKEIQEWKDNISKATKGKAKSDKAKLAMKVPKGPQEKAICPYCLKEGGMGNMKRFHFENCKKKPK